MGLGYIKKQVDQVNNDKLEPVIQKALDDYKQSGNVSEEQEKAFKEKLKLEQLRCQVMTKDSIGEERKGRAKITFIGTSVGAIGIFFLALLIAPASAPFLLGLIIAAGVQYALSVGTIKDSRNARLEGAAKSVLAMQIKADQDKALEVAKPKENVVNAKAGAGKDEAKSAIWGLSAQDPAFSNGLAKIRAANSNKSKEDALPLPKIYGISNPRNLGGRAASAMA